MKSQIKIHRIRTVNRVRKVKDMQRSETEAIGTKIQSSKPKREILNITNSQNTKRTYGQPSKQLSPKRWPLSNRNRTKNNMNTHKVKRHRNSDTKNRQQRTTTRWYRSYFESTKYSHTCRKVKTAQLQATERTTTEIPPSIKYLGLKPRSMSLPHSQQIIKKRKYNHITLSNLYLHQIFISTGLKFHLCNSKY